MRLRLAILLITLAMAASTVAAAQSTEASLIGVLSSNAPAMEKVNACHRLKEIGTPQCIPALAALLADNELSHPARQALETLPVPEAGDALIAALATTAGTNRAGVIDSLGLRRELKAVPALSGLIKDADPVTAAAAATSLGRIGTLEALEPLRGAVAAADASVRAAAVDGLLRCVPQLQADGQVEAAQKIAADLCKMDLPPQFRVAAYSAQIASAGDNKLTAAMDAITGFNGPARLAGLLAVNDIADEEVTRALAGAIQKVDTPTQVALLHALAQRRDAVALPQVVEAASSPESAVRLAALNALGYVGDETVVAMLAQRSASADAAEQEVARQALTMMHDADAGTAIVELLSKVSSAEQVELIKVVALRRDLRAVPTLIDLANGPDEAVVSSALKTLAAIADTSNAQRVVDLLCKTQSQKVREAAEDALVKIAGRTDDSTEMVNTLLSVQAQQAPQIRMAMLSAVARMNFAAAQPALRAAMDEATPEVHSGALRLFTDYCGADSLQDVLALARSNQDDIERTLLLRGYWRLFDGLKNRPAQERFDLVQAGLAEARSEESRKTAVAALADIPLKSAMEAAQQACADETVKPEAQLALSKIAGSLLLAERSAAENALRYLAESAVDESIRTKAAAVFDSMSKNCDYIVPWLVSGPYWAPDKEAEALFDIPLGPELPDGANVSWTPAPANADPVNFWLVDLTSTVAGMHRLLYLKTQVFSPQTRQAVLEMGSDDGIKLWVNDELVHANNAVRGFGPGTDQANVTLKEGWNTFFAKITQSSAGCSMAIRIRPTDGAKPEPLKVEAR